MITSDKGGFCIMSDLAYEQMMYEKILTHVNCVVGVDINFEHLESV